MYDRSIVSVIIPAYNVEAYLADAVTSALQQTARDIEAIIIDDHSSDKTGEIAKRFADGDERVRVLTNEENLGPGASRNRGIEAARGEWIALLDADDRWLAERLERLATFFGDADVVSDDVVIESAGGRAATLLASNGFRLEAPARLRASDLARHQLGLLQPVVRTAFLLEHGIRFDASFRIGEDFRLLVDLLLAGARWVQVPDALYVYRRRPDSITGGRREHVEGRLASDSALLARADVRAEPELERLLDDRVRWLRDLRELLIAAELAQKREWRALSRRFRADPRLAPRLVLTGARHGYHVARRRLRGARPGRGPARRRRRPADPAARPRDA